MKQQSIELARAIDRRISRKINSLNKREYTPGSRSVSLLANDAMNKKELLRVARSYDIAVYYSNSKTPKNYSYRVSKKIYSRVKHLTKHTARSGYRTLRRIKGAH
jgi:hypothetical protein